MSEELYNSHDYCSLAEEYEQARNEIEKLQKILLNFSEYHGSAEKTIEKLNSDVEKWRNTALQLSNNHGQARNKVAHLEADYIISNRELLILQVELARRDEIIKRLREDAERLAGMDCQCDEHWAYIILEKDDDAHSIDCPITLHRALMKELEC